MRFNRFKRDGKLYIRILLGITLCIVVASITTSAIHYLTFSRILQEKVFEFDLSSLRQTSQAVAKTTQSAQTVSFQIYRNSNIAKLLYYKEPNAFDIQGAMMDLNNYLATMPYIQSIYVYNSAAGVYYIAAQNGQKGIIEESAIADKGIVDTLQQYQQYKPFTPIPRIVDSGSTVLSGSSIDSESREGIYTYLCYDAVGLTQKINSAVIVNISSSWINQELGMSGQPVQKDIQTYLIDDREKIFTVNDLTPASLGAAENRFFQEAVRKEQSGYEITNFEGVKSLITYTAPDQYQWHYVRITPYSSITKEISSVRSKTIQIAGVVLLLGLLLSWLLSRFLYAPINRIENRMKDLESEKRNSSYTLRQNTLRKLIQIRDFDPKMQIAKLKSMNIFFDFTQPYRLVYVRIDRFEQLREEHPTDLLTYKFAIMNIASEICSKQYRVDSVDLEEDGILLFVNDLASGMLDEELLQANLQHVQAACSEYLQIGLTIAVSALSEDPHHLHISYKQVKEASNHRYFLGRGSLIMTDDLMLDPGSKYAFPLAKEKRMIDALMAGKSDETKALFQEIIHDTSHFGISIFHSTATHLTVTLSNMIAEIERNGLLQLGLGTELVVPAFEQYETKEDMLEDFFSFFDLLKSKIVEKRSNKQEDLIQRITHIIETRYNDPNLSLNYVAEELKMSTYHISRVYRQQTLTNIVDMINHVRMEKAKELLIQSEQPVTQIAESTGYTSSSYFHRIFKKITGVTPSEFRNANQA
ncbi:helix-turn-helix domain-containing protein [Paenibacillus sp. HB172176]|uniref:helix-turn-helix transcriptional regulator n=1 Tax=Paenibacillus sp. HB172176 TaxID=2493690 RepID=UPI00143BE583|nr:helix-turn-helix domain-containing protein [Paenibacillus sp. HB172176]